MDEYEVVSEKERMDRILIKETSSMGLDKQRITTIKNGIKDNINFQKIGIPCIL